MYLVNQKKYEQNEDYGEWLSLPTTPERLREVLQIVGGDRDGWLIGDIESHIHGISDVLHMCDGLNELNYLAARIEALNTDDIELLAERVDEYLSDFEENGITNVYYEK